MTYVGIGKIKNFSLAPEPLPGTVHVRDNAVLGLLLLLLKT